jgi:hypothetical protein
VSVELSSANAAGVLLLSTSGIAPFLTEQNSKTPDFLLQRFRCTISEAAVVETFLDGGEMIVDAFPIISHFEDSYLFGIVSVNPMRVTANGSFDLFGSQR